MSFEKPLIIHLQLLLLKHFVSNANAAGWLDGLAGVVPVWLVGRGWLADWLICWQEHPDHCYGHNVRADVRLASFNCGV